MIIVTVIIVMILIDIDDDDRFHVDLYNDGNDENNCSDDDCPFFC